MKFSLCLIKHYGLKMDDGPEVNAISFTFIGKIPRCTKWIGGWAGARASLYALEK
jgi:hypothetical protein